MVKSKSKLKQKKLEPSSTPVLTIVIIVLVVISFVLSVTSIVSAMRKDLSRIETMQPTNVSEVSAQEKQSAVEPQKKAEPKPATKQKKPAKDKPKIDPNGCEAKGMQWRADNFKCIPKPTASLAATAQTASAGGSGSCHAEVAKYDWDQSTARAVMMAESGGETWKLNDNPATGDYSVGCFQINIYGANAYSRPSERALKNATINVAFAYQIYKSNGSSFIGQWGVCSRNVSCY